MSLKKERALELKKSVRDGLLFILNDDLEGRSENLKEVYENAVNDAELAAIYAEMRRIAAWLKAGK